MYASWGKYAGKEVLLFRIKNEKGSYVELTNYGATLVSVVVPDKFNESGNVVLGFPSLDGYLSDECYLGSTVGRYANRIGNAKFTLNGVRVQLEQNDNHHNNHGGFSGFHSRVFEFEIHDTGITFTLSSSHGEGGFPGNVQLKVDYSWNADQELAISYEAITDQPTVLNFTNHAYFNLSALRESIFDHGLQIHSDRILETTNEYIPTGKILSAGKYSFLQPGMLRAKMDFSGDKIQGLNNYYVFENSKEKKGTDPDCILNDPKSGRVMEVFTTYPGVQLYTGDYLTSSFKSHLAEFYKPFDGLCLECQYYPDSPNHPNFPSTVVNPGEVYNEQILYRFRLMEKL